MLSIIWLLDRCWKKPCSYKCPTKKSTLLRFCDMYIWPFIEFAMFFCIFLHKDEDVKTILNNLEFISFRIHNITFHLEFITSEIICHKNWVSWILGLPWLNKTFNPKNLILGCCVWGHFLRPSFAHGDINHNSHSNKHALLDSSKSSLWYAFGVNWVTFYELKFSCILVGHLKVGWKFKK